MQCFAKIENNIVVECVVASRDWIDANKQGEWIEYDSQKADGRINIATPNYIYDRDRDDFIIPKPNSNEDPFFDPEVGYVFEEESLAWVNPKWP